MKFNRLPKIFDSSIILFNKDGSFNRSSKKVCLLINSILIICKSAGPGKVIPLNELQHELLRCGIYIEDEEMNLVLQRMMQEELIHGAHTSKNSFGADPDALYN